jgi:hypothetical protein
MVSPFVPGSARIFSGAEDSTNRQISKFGDERAWAIMPNPLARSSPDWAIPGQKEIYGLAHLARQHRVADIAGRSSKKTSDARLRSAYRISSGWPQ